jgi:acyl carrier protein
MDHRERLTNVFRQVFDNPRLEIQLEDSADTIDGWDSLTHVNLVVSIEEEFGFTFSTSEIASIKHVGDFEKLICARAA